MPHVISSLANAQAFHLYEALKPEQLTAGMTPRVLKTVHIKGGSGIADRALVTPHGVVTTVSEEDLNTLRQIDAFKDFEKNGYMVVEEGGSTPAADKFASEMNVDKGSQPRSPAHYEEKDEKHPEVMSATDNAVTRRGKGKAA